jgi:hypothetical protein
VREREKERERKRESEVLETLWDKLHCGYAYKKVLEKLRSDSYLGLLGPIWRFPNLRKTASQVLASRTFTAFFYRDSETLKLAPGIRQNVRVFAGLTFSAPWPCG